MTKITKSKYTHRFLARIVFEAKTPLAVGSGEKDVITDALVATDVNGLPYIPGTALAGVVRSMLEQSGEQSGEQTDTIFGFQKKNDGKGSEIIFSEAKIINSKGKVIDGLNQNAITDSLLKEYRALPIRQHVRINEKGGTDKGGKFDEQVVFAGSRFCFEIEMVSDGKTRNVFDAALNKLNDKTFRIGSGSRNGFGEIEVVSLKTKELDLSQPNELDTYLAKSSNLADSAFWNSIPDTCGEPSKSNPAWTEYKLTISPDDFFLFSSGFGDDKTDITPVRARKVVWNNGEGSLEDKFTLIPASSVKGALAHRVAFHWNKLKHLYAGNPDAKTGNKNEAVQILFGYEDGEVQKRGNLIFSDVIEAPLNDKIINHVSIDRFTGGAMEGALFSEATLYGKGQSYTLTILAKNAVLEGDTKAALELAINDICTGMLPLGGGVNRGNGVFNGSFTINGVQYGK